MSASANKACGGFGPVPLELVDALFDGVLVEEFVDKDRHALAEAVGAVGGLGFGGGVLPLPSLARKPLDFFGIVRHHLFNAYP